MKSKILLWLILTIIWIGWDYTRRRNVRKTLIASGGMIYIASMATLGITMRTILPLFAAHYLAILAAWAALIYYLWRGKMMWWVLLLSLISIVVFVGLNYLEGSRYA